MEDIQESVDISAESMFNPRLLDRLPGVRDIPGLSRAIITNQSVSHELSQRYCYYIDWGPVKDFDGGSLSFKFGDGLQIDGTLDNNLPKIIGTSINTYPHSSTSDIYNNPSTGVTAFLISIVSVNAFANLYNKVTHVARCNKNSGKFYERLRRAGIYTFCDLNLNTINSPVKVCLGNTQYTLYKGLLPSPYLSSLEEKFTTLEIVNDLSALYWKSNQYACNPDEFKFDPYPLD